MADMDTVPNPKAAGAAAAITTSRSSNDFASAAHRVLCGHDLPQPRSPALRKKGAPTLADGVPPVAALSLDAAPSRDAAAGAAGAAALSLRNGAGGLGIDGGDGDHDGDDDALLAPLPEPFKIKMVERISLPPRAHREARLAEAGYNVFCLKSSEVFVDLLTDSGMSALSDRQWAGMLATPQAYAGGL